MTEVEAKDLLRRFLGAMTRMDLDTARQLVHPDYVLEHPQSGEVLRGRERFLAMLSAVPGGIPTDSTDESRARLYVDDDRWAVSPMLTPIRVTGSEGTYTTTVPIRYPDATWHLIAISEIRDGLIVRTTQYWAPEFAPAEWRAPFVDPIPRAAPEAKQPQTAQPDASSEESAASPSESP
ncbi:MAG: nuclear transport factor 2 family protein [Chloroflexota bacterium]|nr:nuclear transport factor 2 family protein [Chloroflexota bacterium]